MPKRNENFILQILLERFVQIDWRVKCMNDGHILHWCSSIFQFTPTNQNQNQSKQNEKTFRFRASVHCSQYWGFSHDKMTFKINAARSFDFTIYISMAFASQPNKMYVIISTFIWLTVFRHKLCGLFLFFTFLQTSKTKRKRNFTVLSFILTVDFRNIEFKTKIIVFTNLRQ